MAKVKFSALISEMRNKLNGSVFSRNRAGAYLRTKVTPINPRTSLQNAVRELLTSLSQNWRNLTEAQRDAWNAAVHNFQKTDIFGDMKTPSGINLYTKLNLNLANADLILIDVPPLPGEVAQNKLISLGAVGGVTNLAVTMEGAVPANSTLIIETTPPVSAGKYFVSSEYGKLTKADAGVATPIDINDSYVAKYGALITGTKIFVRVKFINNTTGIASGIQTASYIVA